jgi:hypothetical protein
MAELAKMIEKQVALAMQKSNSNTKQVAVKSAQDRVDSEIYTYKPKMYTRTGTLKDSWETKDVVNGIVLENTYKDDGDYVIETVETGEGYDYTGYGYDYEKPRPVVALTREDLKDGRLIEAVKKDLKSSGIEVK